MSIWVIRKKALLFIVSDFVGDIDLKLLAKKQDPDSLFFQRKLKMSGSTELGLFVKNFLDSFDTNSSFIGKNFNQIMQKGYPFLRKIICET